MNIAILIGVSEYKRAGTLPACTTDIEHMHRLLAATKRYDDICCLTTQTASTPLKEALRGFFKKHQEASGIAEAFVYFSGHGVYQTDALLCCSDFDPSRPATTSISNEELDDLLRSVEPDVAVKVIDACQSGSPYIKDSSSGFEKALGTSRLKSFICMASSRQDQSSYASAEASAFTARWIDAALYKQEGTVLYRDIQAALADAFVNNPEQTPFFVSQGSGLETFAVVTDEMRRLAAERSKAGVVAAPGDTGEDLIAAAVARLDAIYISAEEASRTIEQAGSDLDREPFSEPIVARFYEKRVSKGGKLGGLPRSRAVAKFAEEQGWSKKYFVNVQTEQYVARVTKDPLTSILSYRHLKKEDYVTEVRERPSQLEATQLLPFEVAEVMFQPKNHPSLRAFVLYIGIVHSLTEVMVLSAIVRLTEKGWSERSPDLTEVKWRFQSYLWKDLVSQPKLIWKEAVALGEDAVKSYLEGLLPKKDDSLPREENTKNEGATGGLGNPLKSSKA